MTMYFAINTLADDFFDQLAQAAIEAQNADQTLTIYALIDTAFFMLDKSSKKSTWLDQAVSIYRDTELAALCEASPHLIAINLLEKNTQLQLRKILNACNGKPMLSIIASPLSIDDLTNRFKPFLEISAEDEQSFVLRFADTRILPVLDGILCDEQLPEWRHGISHWWYPNRHGNLVSLPEYATQNPSKKLKTAHLKLTQSRFNQLIEAGDADAVLDAIFDQNPAFLVEKKPSHFYTMIQQLQIPIRTFEINNFTDIVLFCTTALATNAQFYEQTSFKALLEKKAWKIGALGSAFSEIDDSVWAQITVPTTVLTSTS